MINEADNWSVDGASFLAPELLTTIQLILEQAPVILEHRHYRGARSPNRMVFDEYDDLIAYLHAHRSRETISLRGTTPIFADKTITSPRANGPMRPVASLAGVPINLTEDIP
jgi:hypothetical protein